MASSNEQTSVPYAKYAGNYSSVSSWHEQRTAENSCAYLLSHIKPHMHILDIGCGPGTITCDLATHVPSGQITGLDPASPSIEKARKTADERGIKNADFDTGDIFALPFEDGTFDIVHAHQVLQHLPDPTAALKEMKRVTKAGGLVASREAVMDGVLWYPPSKGIDDWSKLELRVKRSSNATPETGRKLQVYAREAGFDREKVTVSTTTWTFCDKAGRLAWSSLWVGRMEGSAFGKNALENGFCSQEELNQLVQAMKDWAEDPDGWCVVVHSEMLARVE